METHRIAKSKGIRMRWFCLVFVLLFGSELSAQDLFEEAVSGDTLGGLSQQRVYELNGFIRSCLYAGKVPGEDEAEMKSGYAEAALMLRVRVPDFGDGFAELRFRKGHEFGENVDELIINEAYVNTYVGRFDCRIGHQIVVWGRADGFNPTDNVTPKNPLVRSPDEDDRREANFLIRAYYNRHPLRLETIWVPHYAASVLPTSIISLPPGVAFIEPDYPGANLGNSAFALKLNMEFAAIDGSLSYFNGCNPNPGIAVAAQRMEPTGVESDIVARAYRMHVVGADFSTTVMGNIGLRGEFAHRRPFDDWEENIHIPNPDLQCVIGFDTEYGGAFGIIVQYIGRYVFEYTELTKPIDPSKFIEYQIALRNRMISFQLNELSHSISFRPELKLLYETLSLEMLGMYDITTEELFLRPKMSYDIADALTVTVGGDIYSGPDETLFGSLDEYLNSFFVELRSSF